MARKLIPVRPDLPHQESQYVLSGVTYTLEVRWNDREGYYYLDIRTEDGKDIAVGRKVVCNLPFGGRSKDPRRPAGFIIAHDTTGRGLDPGYGELGTGARVQLIYIEPS